MPAQAHSAPTFEIVRTYETRSVGKGSSSSSSGHTTLVERTIAATPEGVVLDYDLPSSTNAEQRTREWRFPAHILRRDDGALGLLDPHVLEARRDRWMKAAKLPASACGQWSFTWTAFKIECDPHAVIETVRAYQLPARLREGDDHAEPGALGRQRLVRDPANPGHLRAVYRIDPDVVRRNDVQSDLVANEITGMKVDRSEVERKRAAERHSGTMTVTFEMYDDVPVKETTFATIETVGPSGGSTLRSSTVTIARRPVGGPAL